MALTARYLVDKSAFARFGHAAVGRRLRPLMELGLVATCDIIDLEILYSARNRDDFEAVLEERGSFERVPVTPEVTTLAIELQRALAAVGQHRVPIPDLLISAAARTARIAVLHYDADFERIARIGGAEHEWVAERGSL